jgi:RNA polymerase sigma-70 factor (ECF subfamily)
MMAKSALRLVDSGNRNSQHLSDDGLMLRAADDDLQAFTRLVTRYETPIRRFCFGMLGSQTSAEETAQEVFLKLWLNRMRYKQSNRFKAYIYTIARNRCLSQLRRGKILSFVGLSAAEKLPAQVSRSDVPFEAAERDALIRAAVATLPPKMRSAVLLRYIEEMPYEEIAEILGKSTSAVRSRVHYGLKALAKRLPEEVRTW